MGIDYRPMLGYGKVFDTLGETLDFLRDSDKIDLTEEEWDAFLEDPTEGDIGDDGLCLRCLNAYSGRDWFLGWEISTFGSAQEALSEIEETYTVAEAFFGVDNFKLIHEVEIY